MSPLASARQPPDKAVKIFAAVEERLDRHALILPVGAHVVDVAREPRVAVGRDAGVA
jgi:hypothetical protein